MDVRLGPCGGVPVSGDSRLSAPEAADFDFFLPAPLDATDTSLAMAGIYRAASGTGPVSTIFRHLGIADIEPMGGGRVDIISRLGLCIEMLMDMYVDMWIGI